MDNNTFAPDKKLIEKERRRPIGDRRKTPSEGFTRISMAGWICRREHARRKDDKSKFFYADK